MTDESQRPRFTNPVSMPERYGSGMVGLASSSQGPPGMPHLPLILYNLLQALFIPVAGPPFLLYQACRKKYRGQLPGRLGLRPRTSSPRSGTGDSDSRQTEPVWIHALSYGEVAAAKTLVTALADRLGGRGLHLTASTSTGISAMGELARQTGASFGVMPFDLLPSARRVIRLIKPRLFLLVETDIWPNILHEFNSLGIPALLVNGAISSRAVDRLSKAKWLARLLYGGFSLLAMQSDEDAERLKRCGVDARRISVPGNLKFDSVTTGLDAWDRQAIRRELGVSDDDFLLVLGSTHPAPKGAGPSEEEALAEALAPLSRRLRLRVVVAPREPSRAKEVASVFESHGFKSYMFSRHEGLWEDGSALVVDGLGHLKGLYGASDLAFVGGSLVPVGGHNLLEPAAFGVPVAFGPHVESISFAAEALVSAGGGILIKNARGLAALVSEFVSDPGRRLRASEAAKAVIEANKGVTSRYLRLIEPFLVPREARV